MFPYESAVDSSATFSAKGVFNAKSITIVLWSITENTSYTPFKFSVLAFVMPK